IAGFVEVGEEGTASSTLRPAGKAKFGERLIDVVTEGDFIDAGARVRIIEVHGNRIIVKPVDNSGDTA
ncbi:MAG: NfeD family protein, partial [Phycisphaerae bacterium]|nr:NfeD family protein [Phycisphaerae bacterium]